jgi:nitroreductase
MKNKKAITSVEINQIIAERWSPRAFDNSKEVPMEKIIGMCEAARWAPSSSNSQSYRFIICDKFVDDEAYQKALACVNRSNMRWAPSAPVLVIILFENYSESPEKPNYWSKFDAGLAAKNFTLQATDYGLHTRPFGGFDREAIIQNFHIPENFEPIAMVAVGYLGNPEILNERDQASETAERTRKPLNNNFFLSEWGNGIV